LAKRLASIAFCFALVTTVGLSAMGVAMSRTQASSPTSAIDVVTAAPNAAESWTWPAAAEGAAAPAEGETIAGAQVDADAVADTRPAATRPAATPTPRRTVPPAPTSGPTRIPAPARTAPPTPTRAPTPTPIRAPTPTPTLSATPVSAPSPSLATWTLDLFDSRADRYQDPDYTACTAATTMSMLNTVAYNGSGSGFAWHATTAYSVQQEVLAFERENMTMLVTSPGTDPHGWRNALNYYGWGSLGADTYRDASYSSFDAATKAVVSAMAIHGKPVGILAVSGRHAQVITGYEVVGADPRTGSKAFTIVGVYMTDPLRSTGHRDTFIPYAEWRSGGTWVKFGPYLENDSPSADPIDGKVGTSEWYGHWVIIEPVR
jgi:hypothetical protein